MQPDRRFARQAAARTGLGLKFVAKDMTLTKALKRLGGILHEGFVLKGGTAIARAGYLDTPRFSEDVDLDVYTDAGLRDIGSDVESLLDGLEAFDVSGPRYQPKGIRFDARFDNPFGDRDRIRIEVSPRPLGLLEEVDARGTLLQSPFTGGEACLLRCYPKEGLFARKVHALSGRRDGKDVFDLRGLWRGGISVGDAVIALERYSAMEGLSHGGMLDAARGNLEAMARDTWTVANAANHFIPRSGRPDWGALIEEVGTLLSLLSAAPS